MRKGKKTNAQLVQTIEYLNEYSRKNKAPIWRDIAKRLEKPRRLWAEVNVGKIERIAENKDTLIVPGILLGTGDLNKNVTISAFKISSSAEKKVMAAKGKVIKIEDLARSNPKGTGIKIIGG